MLTRRSWYRCARCVTTWGLISRTRPNRLRRDSVLGPVVPSVFIRTTNGETPDGEDARALPPGWLFGLQASGVRAELRDCILRYQRECFEVWWNAFKGDLLPAAALALVDRNPASRPCCWMIWPNGGPFCTTCTR